MIYSAMVGGSQGRLVRCQITILCYWNNARVTYFLLGGFSFCCFFYYNSWYRAIIGWCSSCKQYDDPVFTRPYQSGDGFSRFTKHAQLCRTLLILCKAFRRSVRKRGSKSLYETPCDAWRTQDEDRYTHRINYAQSLEFITFVRDTAYPRGGGLCIYTQSEVSNEIFQPP